MSVDDSQNARHLRVSGILVNIANNQQSANLFPDMHILIKSDKHQGLGGWDAEKTRL